MDVGIVVARFQVDDLHDGHQLLLRAVAHDNDEVIVVLGTCMPKNTQENPLDFETRKRMVREVLPDAVVLSLDDHPDDEVWSQNLDALLVAQEIPAYGQMILYGGRDSFLQYYTGQYATAPFGHVHHESGTDVRARIGREPRASSDFRAGVIYASQNRYPTVFTTVDVVCFHNEAPQVLLGRKPGRGAWCLPGGFADPECASFEYDAARELMEETNIIVDPIGRGAGKLTYITSQLIDDWRYRKGPDKIKSLLFAAEPTWVGGAVAGDDLEEVAWLYYDAALEVIQDTHRSFLEQALDHYGLRTCERQPAAQDGQLQAHPLGSVPA